MDNYWRTFTVEYTEEPLERCDNTKRFWMVVGPQNGPMVRQTSKEKAVSEAKRLAKNNPGKEFYVVEATDGFVTPEPEVRRVL